MLNIELSFLFLMILCHIIDDFVLQPVCLSNLKRKEWWNQNYNGKLYKNDYKMALFIHCLSWSIMIHLPLLVTFVLPWWILLLTISINTLIHYIVDDLKANKYKINLITDQSIHLVQIIITFLIYSIICN